MPKVSSPKQPKISKPKVSQSFVTEQKRLQSLPSPQRQQLQQKTQQRFPALLRLANSAQTNPVVAQLVQKALSRVQAG